MTGAIGSRNKNIIALSFHPVKIAGNNIFWLIKHKRFRHIFFNQAYGRNDGILKTLGIRNGVYYFFLLYLHHFILPANNNISFMFIPEASVHIE